MPLTEQRVSYSSLSTPRAIFIDGKYSFYAGPSEVMNHINHLD
jgi:hypothetical protein